MTFLHLSSLAMRNRAWKLKYIGIKWGPPPPPQHVRTGISSHVSGHIGLFYVHRPIISSHFSVEPGQQAPTMQWRETQPTLMLLAPSIQEMPRRTRQTAP